MTGYVRQSTANIQTAQPITAAPLSAEFNQLQTAFNGTTGHTHDGGVGNGPLISLTASISGVLPLANGGTNAITAAAARTSLFGVSTTVDNTLARYDGVAGALQTSPIVVSDAGAVSGLTTLAIGGALSGVTTLGMAGALTGVTSLTMAGALSGVTTLAMGGALSGVTTLGVSGAITASGGGSLTGTWTNMGTVTTIDINGGTIDGTVIGGSSVAAGSFAAVVGTTGTFSSTVAGTTGSFPSGVIAGVTTLMTDVSASGTAVTFTGIPSWAKRITIMLSGVSLNGGNSINCTLGDAGGLEVTGYAGGFSNFAAGTFFDQAWSTSATLAQVVAADTLDGSITWTLQDATTNKWVMTAMFYVNGTASGNQMAAGSKSLSATLDRVSINSASTFDAGTINVQYSG